MQRAAGARAETEALEAANAATRALRDARAAEERAALANLHAAAHREVAGDRADATEQVSFLAPPFV